VSGAYEIVRYRPEHEEGVALLQTALWSSDPAANRRYFEWKYEANPWADEPHVYLAVREGRVVGMRGFYESRWEVGIPARVVAVPLADDFAIDAGERNTGLATRIMRAALADLAKANVDYVFSLSAGIVAMLGSLVHGWKSAGSHEPWVRREPGRRMRVRERLVRARGLWRWAGAPVLRSSRERRPFEWLDADKSARRGVVISREPRPDAIAELSSAAPRDGRLRHVRTREYLAWRFANPMHDYRFLYAEQEGKLAGYLVLRARTMGLEQTAQVLLADLEGRDARVRAELLDAAIAAGRFAELVAWSARLGAHERALLRERGFAPLDPERNGRGAPCLLARATGAQTAREWTIGSRPLLDPASWDLRPLDSMAG
jgi:GNAT superfamily N-acetyltransferase